MPADVYRASAAVVGALLGLATFAGELPDSFVKRRLRIVPGGHRGGALGAALMIVDQADFVLAAWALLASVYRMSARAAAAAFAAVAADTCRSTSRPCAGRPQHSTLTLQIRVQRLCRGRDRA